MLKELIIKNIIFFFILIVLGCSVPTPHELEVPEQAGIPKIPEDNPTTLEGVELGRYLFYDKRLSRDNTIACGTCHIQKFAFTERRKRAMGIDSARISFNTMTLTNALLSTSLFWDGRGVSLEKQALAPVVNHHEMDLRLAAMVEKLEDTDMYPGLFKNAFKSTEITARKVAHAISQFERTLISFNSKYDSYLEGESELTKLETDGMNLFFTTPEPIIGIRGGGCVNCHLSYTFAGSASNFDGYRNNGLNKSHYKDQGRQRLTYENGDYGKFKVPTLRNIEVTSPYMHDGRFKSLVEVLDHYSENLVDSETLDSLFRGLTNDSSNREIGLRFTPQEKKAIVAFLKTLTDGEFLTNPNFSDPFLNQN